MANTILEAGLKDIIDIPVISEETELPEQEERAQWPRFWLIDPLDGTKEFIDRNGEFTVNIALIEQGEPVFGLIYVPVTDQCYGKAFLKVGEEPASLLKTISPLKRIRERDSINLYASRRHATEQLVHLCNRLEEKLAQVQLVALGSSIKLAYLAAGQGDIYPRYGNVSEWDIAAGHAILRCVGGDILSKQYESFQYGRDFDWRPLLLT